MIGREQGGRINANRIALLFEEKMRTAKTVRDSFR